MVDLLSFVSGLCGNASLVPRHSDGTSSFYLVNLDLLRHAYQCLYFEVSLFVAFSGCFSPCCSMKLHEFLIAACCGR